MLAAIDLQNDIFDDRGSGYVKWTEKVKDGIEARIKMAVEKMSRLYIHTESVPGI